ncbi:MAG TPA: molybdopterin cofactor-binding domain-containing protein [Opitutaceae bacterium]|nr:molybdopterin cofactor-binding domain-containing protein [Opitutaceae bacterium]
MSEPHPSSSPEIYPEQYELRGPAHAKPPRFRRRAFLKLLGAGVVVLCVNRRAAAKAESGAGGPRLAGGTPRPATLDAWLQVAPDGTVTFFTGKTEMGQNIRTSLTQAVAEELPAPIGSIRAVMADTDLTPYDAGTFGSRSTPDMGLQLRRAAATAREALIDLAAARWSVDRGSLTAADGRVIHPPSRRSVGFGELAAGGKLVRTISSGTALKPATQWRIAGLSVPKVDGRQFVSGRHRYASDMALPGMLFGSVLRPPAYGATLESLDVSRAEAMPGVKVVRDGEFVGAVAPSSFEAARAVAAIGATWKTRAQPSEDRLLRDLRGGGNPPESGLFLEADGGLTLKRSYTMAYIAHVPLEPRAAVAVWRDGKLTVWTGSQRPFGIRDEELTEAFGLGPERLRVIVPDTGSGYGGKHTGRAAVEAARLARAADRPVKVVWTRQEEFTWAYFRPAGVIDVASRVRADGKLASWDFHNYNSGSAGIAPPYAVPDPQTQFHSADSPLPQGSYRSLAAAANHFARESHVDELAGALKLDPLEFRLRNMTNPRLRAVAEAGARAFAWGGAKAAGHGSGMAVGLDKGGHVATFAEVAVDASSGRVGAVRVVQAFECGAVVNPDHLRLQLEGAVVQGLGGALFEAVHFENGRILNPHLSAYRVPRFSDAPAIEIVLVDRRDLPSAGAGETGIVGIAPALGNAICDATGVRLRSLPMVPDGLRRAS